MCTYTQMKVLTVNFVERSLLKNVLHMLYIQQRLILIPAASKPTDIQFSSNAPISDWFVCILCALFQSELPTHPVVSRLSQITNWRGCDRRGTICQLYAWVSNAFTIHYSDRTEEGEGGMEEIECVYMHVCVLALYTCLWIFDIQREGVYVK